MFVRSFKTIALSIQFEKDKEITPPQKTLNKRESEILIPFHFGQTSSCAAQICKAKGLHASVSVRPPPNPVYLHRATEKQDGMG